MVLRMLRVALPPEAAGDDGAAVRDGQALALLQAVGGFQAFRRAVQPPPDALPVGRFLLLRLGTETTVARPLRTGLPIPRIRFS